jgi:hypothetical protein
LSPFFQRGNFLARALTPPFDELRAGLGKRGGGEIFNGMSCELCGGFLGQENIYGRNYIIWNPGSNLKSASLTMCDFA